MTEAHEVKEPPSTQDSVGDADREDPSGHRRYRTTEPSVIRSGLGFALIAVFMSIQPLCFATYVRLFFEKSEQLVQPPLPEGMPIPQSLAWSPRLLSLISNLGTLTSAAVLGLLIFFSCLFLYGLFKIVNPTFRMTTGVDWNHTLLWKTYMHSEPITKAFLIAIAACIPAFVVWQLIGWALGENSFSVWFRLALCGAAFWILFSRDGVAGDYESGSYEPTRTPTGRNSLLLRGAAAGTVAWLMLRFSPRFSTDELYQIYRSIGYIGPGQWEAIAFATLGFAAAFGFAAGGVAVSLGAPGWTLKRRSLAAAIPTAVLVAAAYCGRVYLPQVYQSRYDYPAVKSESGEARLVRLAGLNPAARAKPRQLLLFESGRIMLVQLTGLSVTKIPAGPDSAAKIEAFLKSRDFRTSLAYPAFTTLHDAASLNWSVSDALRIYLENIENAPDMAYVTHLLNKLAGSAFTPSPEVIAALDLLSDERKFDLGDRRAWVSLGDMYGRFGEKAKAENCYKKANMPPSQVSYRADERTAIPKGSVTGRLSIRLKPAAGARIGLVSEDALQQLVHLRDPDPKFASPYWLSWIGAATYTDSHGNFSFAKLVPGRYVLLVELPAGQDLNIDSLASPTVRSPFTVSQDSLPLNLGDIDLAPAAAPGGKPK